MLKMLIINASLNTAIFVERYQTTSNMEPERTQRENTFKTLIISIRIAIKRTHSLYYMAVQTHSTHLDKQVNFLWIKKLFTKTLFCEDKVRLLAHLRRKRV